MRLDVIVCERARLEAPSAFHKISGDIALQRSGVMSGMAQVNEKRAILTPSSLSLPTADSPAFIAESATPMYRGAIEEFEFAWSNCAEKVT